MRAAPWLAGIAIGCEIAVAFVFPMATTGHRWNIDWISEAAAIGAPFAEAMRWTGWIGAVAHLVLLQHLIDRHPRYRWPLVAAAGFVFLLAVSLLFQCDPGCIHGTPEAITHYVLGISAFLGLGAAAGIMTLRTRQDSGVMAWTSRILLATLAVALAADVVNVGRGFGERLALTALWLWTIAWVATSQAADQRA